MGFFILGVCMGQLTVLLNEIAQCLKEKSWQLVTAESCTGGLISSLITEIPGSSLWFERGFVTYSNLAKEEMLGVSPALISQFGAVSEEVALAMAAGALQHSEGQVALAVTGIAGPDGGSVEKPVGTVCFGWARRECAPVSLKMHFQGNRQEVRHAACERAMLGVLEILKASK